MDVFIEYVRYLFLGILQGLTEPLPISSSGHLVIVQQVFDIPNVSYFLEVFLHFASLLAIVVFYRVKLKSLIIGNFQYLIKKDKTYKNDFHYVLLILLAVIPAVVAGGVFLTFFESFLNLLAVGISLLFTGAILLFVHRASIENQRDNINVIDALTIGVFQIFALLPGISRSGSTMTGGLVRGVKFEKILEFSFLLYIPIALGSMILMLPSAREAFDYQLIPLVLAFIGSAVMTFYALKWFILLVQKGNLKYFAYYCFVVGGLSIIFATVF